MHRIRAACLAALLNAAAWPAHATGESAPPPMVVLFDTPPGELPEAEIRERIATELGRPVRSTPEPDLPTLSVARGASGSYIVRYRRPGSELERKVAPPARAEHLPLFIAFLAKNLVSDEARDLMAELDTQKSPAARQPDPSAGERGSRFYLRFSLGGGYSAAAYSTSITGTSSSRGTPYDVGLSGGEVGFHAAIGSMHPSGVAFGVEASAGLSLFDQHGSLGRSSLRGAVPLQLGGFVDYYPEARGPLHLQGGLSVAHTGFAYSTLEEGPSVDGNLVVVRQLYGGMAYVGAGYDFGPKGAGGFGLFARTHAGFFADGTANFVPLGFQLGVSMAWL
ncbi:MAG TPA: hypothetical protein VK540_00460 [Polyangiaceae bacterium]|nr:hypothetical protein [Polyangiaceae bacterium]